MKLDIQAEELLALYILLLNRETKGYDLEVCKKDECMCDTMYTCDVCMKNVDPLDGLEVRVKNLIHGAIRGSQAGSQNERFDSWLANQQKKISSLKTANEKTDKEIHDFVVEMKAKSKKKKKK